MKLAAQKKKQPNSTPSTPPCNPPSSHLDGEQPTFFAHIIKVAGIGRKELQYDLRVSKTLVDLWLTGEKHDPFTRARDTAALFIHKGRTDLLPMILSFIAGGDLFDGAVLSAEQTEALRQLAKAVR